MDAPDLSAADRKSFVAPTFGGKIEQTYTVERALTGRPDVAAQAKVQPSVLSELREKRSTLRRLAPGMRQLSRDAGDGRLVLGALFTFLSGKVDATIERRLAGNLDPNERQALESEVANINDLKAKAAAAGQAVKDERKAHLETLGETANEAQDEVDYLSAKQALSQGAMPDSTTLQGAISHRNRVAAKQKDRLPPGADPLTTGTGKKGKKGKKGKRQTKR